MYQIGPRLTVIGLLLCAACDKQADEEQIAAAAAAEPVAPQLGGTVVAAGKHFVEVRPEQSGTVEAQVYDAEGKPLGAEAKLELSARVQTEHGKQATVPLVWEPEMERYHGELDEDAGLIVAGPVDVNLTVDGKAHTAKMARLAVIPPPQHGGAVVAAGEYSAELLPTSNGEVHAFVNDAQGKPIEGKAGAHFYADVSVETGPARRVELRWSKPKMRYVGKVEGHVKVVPGPVVFSVEQESKPTMSGGVQVVAVAPEPSIDGSIVLVGDHAVEVHAVDDHEVEAVVFAPSGAIVRDADAEIDVNVRVSPGVVHPVKMVWHTERHRYVGKLHAEAKWGAPFDVRLRRSHHYHYGAVYARPAVATVHAEAKFEASFHVPVHMQARADVRGFRFRRVGHARAHVRAAPPSAHFTARVEGSADHGKYSKGHGKKYSKGHGKYSKGHGKKYSKGHGKYSKGHGKKYSKGHGKYSKGHGKYKKGRGKGPDKHRKYARAHGKSHGGKGKKKRD